MALATHINAVHRISEYSTASPDALRSLVHEHMRLARSVDPWTHAGLPVISLPCGRGRRGLPLGLQCIGRFGQDARLVGAVLSLETRLRARGIE